MTKCRSYCENSNYSLGKYQKVRLIPVFSEQNSHGLSITRFSTQAWAGLANLGRQGSSLLSFTDVGRAAPGAPLLSPLTGEIWSVQGSKLCNYSARGLTEVSALRNWMDSLEVKCFGDNFKGKGMLLVSIEKRNVLSPWNNEDLKSCLAWMTLLGSCHLVTGTPVRPRSTGKLIASTHRWMPRLPVVSVIDIIQVIIHSVKSWYCMFQLKKNICC